MKIVTILGARPQFIKASMVSKALAKANVAEIIVHTGQHFDQNMSDVFFSEMEIPRPHHNLEINNLSHAAMTGRMLEKIESVLQTEKPDAVLVYGDTNSTLAGTLAASKLHIPVAHVEAGLRSFDTQMPEEINRILTDRLSTLLFCPTKVAVDNLHKEGFRNFNCTIDLCGDVMYDAFLYFRKKAKQHSTIVQSERLSPGGFVLTTLHRAENTNDTGRLTSICHALNEINKTIPVVMPLHPRTKQFIDSKNIALKIKLIDPVGYFDMLMLLENCKMVMTDSGGLQKEAFMSGKFCITLRDQTEWVELVKAGANVVVGADAKKIRTAFTKNLKTRVKKKLLYGSGHASEKIAKVLLKLSRRSPRAR